jgi:hypothetical protein
MTSRTREIAERALPGVAVEMLESVHQHRLLSTAQLHTLHTPATGRRWTQLLLGELRARDLVRFVRTNGAGKLWFATEQGADAVEALGTRAEPRRKVIAPAHAAGPLRQHTLAVNQAAIAFVIAARERGDDCGPLSWRHEIAHPIGRPPGRRHPEQLIVDALLTYLHTGVEGDAALHYRFLELDRATLPVDALAAKLTRYARLYHYTPDIKPGESPRPGWRTHYPAFPAVHVLLAGGRRRALERRLEQVIALAHTDAELTRTQQVAISFAHLEDLNADGPFARIFVELNSPERLVDWLGRPAADESRS